jgi:hypothetical protein
MAYTTINKSGEHFNTKLYTGNGSTQTISSVGFQPDFTWIKHRDGETAHMLFDYVRGALKRIQSNTNNSETTANNTLTSWNSDGFALGTENDTNGNGRLFASWNWKANGSGSSNTDGSTTSTVSVNTTSGFSIVKYTGTSSAATIGHGLGAVPKMIIVKNLSSGSRKWVVWHHNLTSASKYLSLSSNATEANDTATWNNTLPTSTVFSSAGSGEVNQGGQNFIAYCFADVQGYQKMGGYTGNNTAGGSNTQFVYTGFRPKLVMVKEISGTSNWVIYDLNRNYSLTENNRNIRAARLGWDLDSAESSFTSDNGIDILSNGFNIRDNSNDLYTINANNETYGFYAVGQSLVGTNNVPCTAV